MSQMDYEDGCDIRAGDSWTRGVGPSPLNDLEPQLILQKHPFGCGHAALAMLTGKGYEEIVAEFPGVDPTLRGLKVTEIDIYAAINGMAVLRLFSESRNSIGEKTTTPWPPAPFAQVHLCLVDVTENSPCAHWVVMLADGAVLDPTTTERKSLFDYHRIMNVAGIYKIQCTARATGTIPSR